MIHGPNDGSAPYFPQAFVARWRLFKGVEHELGGHGGRDFPAHDPAGEHTNDKRHIDHAIPGLDIGEVRAPELVGGLGPELPVDPVIGTGARRIRTDRDDLPAPDDTLSDPSCASSAQQCNAPPVALHGAGCATPCAHHKQHGCPARSGGYVPIAPDMRADLIKLFDLVLLSTERWRWLSIAFGDRENRLGVKRAP